MDIIQQILLKYKKIQLKHITKEEVVDYIRELFSSEVAGLTDDLILKKYSAQIKQYIDYKLRIIPQKDSNYIYTNVYIHQ